MIFASTIETSPPEKKELDQNTASKLPNTNILPKVGNSLNISTVAPSIAFTIISRVNKSYNGSKLRLTLLQRCLCMNVNARAVTNAHIQRRLHTHTLHVLNDFCAVFLKVTILENEDVDSKIRRFCA